MSNDEPVYWRMGDKILACMYQQDVPPNEALALGVVMDGETRKTTGDMFLLLERNGDVLQIFQAPTIIFERLQSMIDLAVNDRPWD